MRPVLSLLLLVPLLPATALANGEERACCGRDIRSGSAFSLSGTIVDYDAGEDLELVDANGLIHEILCVGPTKFWQDLGVAQPKVGDKITVEGYQMVCGDDLENAAARMFIGDQTVELRDPETGRPVWQP